MLQPVCAGMQGSPVDSNSTSASSASTPAGGGGVLAGVAMSQGGYLGYEACLDKALEHCAELSTLVHYPCASCPCAVCR